MSTKQKTWTFAEMNAKVRLDLDLNESDPDEQFITTDEMVGYFNEAIDEAEAEILDLHEDYFLTKGYLPLVAGEDEYDLPDNIFARKIRGVIYELGATRYRVRKIRDYNKFEEISFAQAATSTSDDYRYTLRNDGPGQVRFVLLPAARETAVLPPLSNTSTPITVYYIRNANRIPILGEYTNDEDVLASAVSTAAGTIAVSPDVTYVTGDQIKFSAASGNAIPGGLTAGTVYYVIAVSATSIKVASSAANASAGTAITLTSTGTNYFTIQVAATQAIIDATPIDIPEFSTFIMEWVKANCLLKDGDPRISATVAKVEAQRKQMVDTLTDSEPDNDDEVTGDFSHYSEMS